MGHKVILLVEDNPDDEELSRLAFQRSRMVNPVVVVRDGEEALDYVFGTGTYEGRDVSTLPAVVFLDIKLPKVNGFEVLRRLRADARTALLPIVLLTSSREEQDIRHGYRLGANSYVVKPVEFEKFIRTLGQLGVYWGTVNETPSRLGER